MINFIQEGDTLTLTPGAAVAAGAGFMFGTTLFGVATSAVASGTPGEFITQGVIELAKTSALQIDVGDLVYWVPGSSVVNKTTTSQRAVGVAVVAALNPSPTVMVKLGVPSLPGT